MFARGSAPVVGLAVLVSAAVLSVGMLYWRPLIAFGVILLALAAFVAWFFRDPERKVGKGVVAAADGVVHAVADEGDRVRIATFMNVHDVHVNRAPVAGKVLRSKALKGPYLPAYDKRAAKNNRRAYVIRSDIGDVEVVQICGIFARRIVPFVDSGAKVAKGERIGMIRFGSRVDVLLPKHTTGGDMVTVLVRPDERVHAASTTLATITKKKRSSLPEVRK